MISPADSGGRPDGKRLRLALVQTVLVAALCALASSILLPTLNFAFVHDDNSQIVFNQQVQSWKFLPRILSSDVWSQKGEGHVAVYYRPLFSLWLLLVHTIGGLNAWFWHFCSLLAYAVNVYLVFRLTNSLLENLETSAFTAVFFAVYPIHVEAVSWVSAADELLLSAFFLGSLLVFMRFLQDEHRKSSVSWLSVVLWFAALCSKETALALLPVFFALPVFQLDQRTCIRNRAATALRMCTPFVAAAIVYLGLRALALHRVGTELGRQSWKEVALTAADLLQFYLTKLFYPVHLSPFYDKRIVANLTPRLLFVVAMAAVLVMCSSYWAIIRKQQTVALATCLILLPLSPVLLGVRVFRDGDVAHDRYLFLPSVGVCLLTGLLLKFLLEKWPFGRQAIRGVAALLLIVFAVLTISQQRYYRDDEALYKRGLEIGPSNALVLAYLGIHYFKHGDPSLGLEQFRRAYSISPENPDVSFRFVNALIQTGNNSEAESVLTRMTSDSNLSASQREVLGVVLGQAQMRLGKLLAAESTLRTVAASNENLRDLHRSLGQVYEMEGKLYDASHEYEREYQISGDIQSHRRAIYLATRR